MESPTPCVHSKDLEGSSGMVPELSREFRVNTAPRAQLQLLPWRPVQDGALGSPAVGGGPTTSTQASAAQLCEALSGSVYIAPWSICRLGPQAAELSGSVHPSLHLGRKFLKPSPSGWPLA